MKKTSLTLSLVLILFAGGVWAKEICDEVDFRKKNSEICEVMSFTETEFNEWRKGMTTKIWNNYPQNKAIAIGANPKNRKGAFFCNDKATLRSAKECALKGCESLGLACFVAMWNDEELDEEEAKKAKKVAVNKYLGKKKKTPKQKIAENIPLNAHYTVQIGAYSDVNNAIALKEMLQVVGLDPRIDELYLETKDKTLYAERIGVFNSKITAQKNKKIITIGLAYSFQKVKKIPINKYDIKLDFVITEKQN